MITAARDRKRIGAGRFDSIPHVRETSGDTFSGSPMLRPSSVLFAFLLLGAPAAASTAGAAEMTGPELAKARVCLACHQIDSKRVGPAWKSVAAKYAGQPDAQSRLETSIRRGSANRWGKVPMPAQNHVSEDEARRLAAWILTLNK
jgi:cytochrome c